MLRVTTLKASGAQLKGLLRYYAGLAQDQQSRDGAGRGPVDYYLDPDEPPGRWWGGGVDAFDLDGQDVEPEPLQALLEARHPVSGVALGRGFGDRSARGFDATFSAPKSVSVLWGLSPDPWVRAEVLDAHDTAVDTALAWLEEHGAVTRRGKDGVDQVDTQGLTVAVFRQHTSRTADPQLHTHAIVSAKVQDPTGRWLSLDARFLKKQQRTIGWIYDAALRTELTSRLGVEWEDIVEGLGQADLTGVPEALRELFSQRSAQVEAKLAELVRRWVDEHDGAEPDPWTIAELTRRAVLASRPAKKHGIEADELRRDWVARAEAVGFDRSRLPTGREPRTLSGIPWDRDEVIRVALRRVSEQGSTWLHADLARELATLVPADAAPDGRALTALIDQLAREAGSRCVELHPPASRNLPRRRDGRPVSEHVTDRHLTTRAVLDQEAHLIAWADTALEQHTEPTAVEAPHLDPAQRHAAAAAAGHARLVLVVGPAGTGKTTTLASVARSLTEQGRPVIGLAPSGKAADVLHRETGLPTATLAKLLYEHARPGGPSPAWQLPKRTTVIVDEASMAATDDLDRLTRLAERHGWRVVCVGDPHQLPAVGRGGMFAHWCDTQPAHHLDQPRRFTEPWEAHASLALRRGDPTAVDEYAAHGRLHTSHPDALADRVARQWERATRRGETTAITTTSAATARTINREIQHRQGHWQHHPGVRLHDRTEAFPGDRIATRANQWQLQSTSGQAVRNRHTWTVTAVHTDGALTAHHPDRGTVVLPADYVAEHVELGWAVTGYGGQGITTDASITIIEPGATRAGIYTGLTRGRTHNHAWIIDPEGLDDPADTLARHIERPPSAQTAHALRDQLHHQQGLTYDTERDRARQLLERLRTRQRSIESRGRGR